MNEERIKMYYENWKKGLRPAWSLDMVWNMAQKGKLSAEGYQRITGYVFPERG